MSCDPAGQFRADPAQLHVTCKESAEPLVNSLRGDKRRKMVAPDFCRRAVGGKIAVTHDNTAAIRRAEVQTVMHYRRSKQHHLRILPCGNKGAVSFSDHKNAIKRQPA